MTDLGSDGYHETGNDTVVTTKTRIMGEWHVRCTCGWHCKAVPLEMARQRETVHRHTAHGETTT